MTRRTLFVVALAAVVDCSHYLAGLPARRRPPGSERRHHHLDRRPARRRWCRRWRRRRLRRQRQQRQRRPDSERHGATQYPVRLGEGGGGGGGGGSRDAAAQGRFSAAASGARAGGVGARWEFGRGAPVVRGRRVVRRAAFGRGVRRGQRRRRRRRGVGRAAGSLPACGRRRTAVGRVGRARRRVERRGGRRGRRRGRRWGRGRRRRSRFWNRSGVPRRLSAGGRGGHFPPCRAPGAAPRRVPPGPRPRRRAQCAAAARALRPRTAPRHDAERAAAAATPRAAARCGRHGGGGRGGRVSHLRGHPGGARHTSTLLGIVFDDMFNRVETPRLLTQSGLACGTTPTRSSFRAPAASSSVASVTTK